MKKKLISALLLAAMTASLLVGCGSAAPAAEAPAADAPAAEAPAAEAPAVDTAAAADGTIFNVQVWNEEFKSRVEAHYPGYEKIDANTGKIGDVTVVWTITPNKDNAYQNHLDEALLAQADAAANDKVDMFLVEADYALKYVDTEYAMKLADLGISDADLANQFQYTKDVVTDSNGDLKGASWQGCPGLLIYRRDIAKDVLGTDDPAEVQNYLSDWDKFAQTADKMKAAGYQMTSTTNDTFRVFSNNVSKKWVDNGKVQVDDNIWKWVDSSKAMVDAGQTGTADLWSDDWSKGFYTNSNVFCYFGPAWFIDFSMAADAEGSVANAGGWAATEGPQGFYWGGTWICAATGTDNADLVKDIILKLTTDTDIMTDIVKADNDFVNNKPAMEAMAADESYSNKVLGGQNPLGKFVAGVSTISLENITPYDQGCNEEFQNAMKNYFEGTATKEEAFDIFKKQIVVKYPELTVE